MKPVAIITGASRGIGRATALLFAAKGYDLAVCCRANTALLEELAAEVQRAGSACLTFTGDMGDPAVCRDFFARAEARYGRVNVLVNNAGISLVGLFQDITPEEWQRILSANLSSVFYCCQEAVHRMLPRQSGSIVNVSSVWGTVGASCETAYSATKGGISALTRALAKELAPSHIRVNAAAFGAIDTDMNRHLDKEERAALCQEISMGRMGTVQEAAELLWRLADGPEYLTGQVVTMDGGWT